MDELGQISWLKL